MQAKSRIEEHKIIQLSCETLEEGSQHYNTEEIYIMVKGVDYIIYDNEGNIAIYYEDVLLDSSLPDWMEVFEKVIRVVVKANELGLV